MFHLWPNHLSKLYVQFCVDQDWEDSHGQPKSVLQHVLCPHEIVTTLYEQGRSEMMTGKTETCPIEPKYTWRPLCNLGLVFRQCELATTWGFAWFLATWIELAMVQKPSTVVSDWAALVCQESFEQLQGDPVILQLGQFLKLVQDRGCDLVPALEIAIA